MIYVSTNSFLALRPNNNVRISSFDIVEISWLIEIGVPDFENSRKRSINESMLWLIIAWFFSIVVWVNSAECTNFLRNLQRSLYPSKMRSSGKRWLEALLRNLLDVLFPFFCKTSTARCCLFITTPKRFPNWTEKNPWTWSELNLFNHNLLLDIVLLFSWKQLLDLQQVDEDFQWMGVLSVQEEHLLELD